MVRSSAPPQKLGRYDVIRRLALRDVTSEAYDETTSEYPGDDSSGDPGQGPDDDPVAGDGETEARSS